MSAKDRIVEKLMNSPHPLATHELDIPGYSENNLATRCSELAKAGLIKGQYRPGENYKEWYIPKGQLPLC